MNTQPTGLYIFLDEAGDPGFRPQGSKYFVLTGVAVLRPFAWDAALIEYKYDLLEYGLDTECFHAAEDNQYVRRRVFEIIHGHLSATRVDSLIVEKRKTQPALQAEERFYPRMLGYLLRHILRHVVRPAHTQVIVITDTIPVKGKSKSVQKAINETLADMLPATVPYKIWHHASKSCGGLQVADYCSWAIQKKWERGDTTSYDLIHPAIKSEFELFRRGTTYFY